MRAMPLLSRREFLRVTVTASGGLLLMPAYTRDASAADAATAPPNPLGVYLRIEPDNRVYIGSRNPEIGQGVKTSVPMIIAEELDADWSLVTVEQLPLGIDFSGPAPQWKFGSQGAGGSTSIPDAWADLRQIGAQARWLMRSAAASQWRIPLESAGTRDGHALHPDGRRLAYGELVAVAATLSLPAGPVALKDPSQYRIIGRPQRVVDAHEIVTGRARYGIDVYEPGAYTAVMLRCPFFDGGIAGYDDKAAKAAPGVHAVLVIPGPKPGEPFTANLATGIAVVAEDTWSALKGRAALKVEWTRGPFATESSALLDRQCEELLSRTGLIVRNDGDFDSARHKAARTVQARYRLPFVSHSPLEPQNAFVHVQADR
ncbi:MAG: molybdopterin cofactor-binding domain-containing protein, partial [Steroidobacteraceae bacterium]